MSRYPFPHGQGYTDRSMPCRALATLSSERATERMLQESSDRCCGLSQSDCYTRQAYTTIDYSVWLIFATTLTILYDNSIRLSYITYYSSVWLSWLSYVVRMHDYVTIHHYSGSLFYATTLYYNSVWLFQLFNVSSLCYIALYKWTWASYGVFFAHKWIA